MAMDTPVLLRRCLTYLGGDFLMVAGVCKFWKETYEAEHKEKITNMSALESVALQSVEGLEYAASHFPELIPKIYRFAVKVERLDILEWLDSRGYVAKFSEQVLICSFAASCGSLDVLQWARKRGFEWNAITCILAIQANHARVLFWALENGCPVNKTVCAAAAIEGRLHLLQCLRDHGCPWDEGTYFGAYNYSRSLGGDRSVLDWVVEQGCPIPIPS
jgi:hypothetical protein